jgi:hypothetical protein
MNRILEPFHEGLQVRQSLLEALHSRPILDRLLLAVKAQQPGDALPHAQSPAPSSGALISAPRQPPLTRHATGLYLAATATE